MVAEKIRIYDLARELGIPNKDLMALLKDSLRIKVKSHSSTIDGDVADKLRAIVAKEKSVDETPEIKKKPDQDEKEIQIEKPVETTIEKPQIIEKKQEINVPTVQEPQIQPTVKVQTGQDLQDQAITNKVVQQSDRPQDVIKQESSQEPISQDSSHRIMKPAAPKQDPSRPLQKTSLEQKEQTQQVQKPSYTPAKLPGVQPYTLSTGKYKRRPENKPYSSQKPSRYPANKVSDQDLISQQATSATLASASTLVQEPPAELIVEPIIEKTTEEQIDAIATTEIKEKNITEITQETDVEKEGSTITPAKNIVEEVKETVTKVHRSGHHLVRYPQQAPHSQNKPFVRPPRPPRPGLSETSTDRGPKTFDRSARPQAGISPKDQPAKDAEAAKFGKVVHKKEVVKKKDYYSKEKERYQDLKPLAEIFKKKKTEKKEVEIVKPTEVYLDKSLTVGELANILVINSTEIIKELMKIGIFATMNQTISLEAAKDVTEKLEYTLLKEPPEQKVEEKIEEQVEEQTVDSAKLQSRAPIVTIMGHVDHGKTTLLDAIRRTKNKIVETEIGGITQSIGAYTVDMGSKKIVFIDTPGHKAFTAMRARGASVTDIVIIIVAADDGVMPQTIEAINHARAAGVPIIVAINKIDKPGADPDKVLQQLANQNLVPEKWGGDIITEEISAQANINIEKLLEWIVLVADLHELKADPTAPATGVVIESELDKGKGCLARLIVQNGTLRVGDLIIVGNIGSKIRALINDEGQRINEAGPSTPVEILGLNEIPQAGDSFKVVNDEKKFKQLLSKLKGEEKEKRFASPSSITLQQDTIFKAKNKKDREEIKDLNIIIKADTDGSVKAVESVLLELKSKEILVKIVHSGVGDISEADVMLASTSGCIIIGFRVKEDNNAIKLSQEQDIQIRTYEIIYEISDDIEKTMLGLLKPELREVELGVAEVRELFTIGKNLVIAGCYVLEGKIVRNRTAKVYRNNKEIFKGNIDNLRRFKDDAKEVLSGFECGISFSKFNDLQVGDLIKVSTIEEIERDNLN